MPVSLPISAVFAVSTLKPTLPAVYSVRPAYFVFVTGTPRGVCWVPSAAASIFWRSKLPIATPAASAPCIE